MEELTINEFLQKLASSDPIPGGGSIAGLSAAIGSALSSMVFSLTLGKKVYNELCEEDKEKFNFAYEQSKKCVSSFTKLMNEDASVFNKFIKVFSMPKQTEEEKKNREKAINEGYKDALQVPMKVLEESRKVYDFILIAAKFGNKSVISDAAVAAIMLHAAVESSIINIKINLSGIKDRVSQKEIMGKCYIILNEGEEKKKAIIKIVEEKLGNL